VILVAVAVDHRIDGDRYTTRHHGHRRVDHHRLAGAAHQQRVARRVGTVGIADQHAHRVGQPSLVVSPIGHALDHSEAITSLV
jgi:hypothetical protein